MIIRGQEAKEKLLFGINELADTVKLTLGARGKTILIRDKYNVGFDITKDGVKSAVSTTFEDQITNSGADFIKNAARKTVEEAGDGTTSTIILTQSACNNINKEIKLGKKVNDLTADLKEDLDSVKNFIKSKSTEVKTTEDIEMIATVSSNNDKEIGSLLKNIYDEVGFNVEIDIVESDNKDTSYEVVNGFTMKDTGYSSTQFINNHDKGRVEYINPRIYMMNGKIRQMNEYLMNIFMQNADRNNEDFRPLVLIVEDIEEAVLREIVLSYSRQMIFGVAVVQTSLIHEDKKNAFIDASIFLDGEYSEDKIGKYGTCEKIVIERDEVTFINGFGDTTKHLKELKKKKNKNIADERRIFALESSAAIIKVGGKIASEISEKKDRIEDAVYAVKSAIEEGYCPGGSSVFIFARKNLELKTEVMKKILLSCYTQLMVNAELEPFYFLRDIEDKGFGYGYNLLTDEVSDFYKDGILDSAKVLRVSLENAIHTACNFASIEAIV